jgi:hypothetical protein
MHCTTALTRAATRAAPASLLLFILHGRVPVFPVAGSARAAPRKPALLKGVGVDQASAVPATELAELGGPSPRAASVRQEPVATGGQRRGGKAGRPTAAPASRPGEHDGACPPVGNGDPRYVAASCEGAAVA